LEKKKSTFQFLPPIDAALQHEQEIQAVPFCGNSGNTFSVTASEARVKLVQS